MTDSADEQADRRLSSRRGPAICEWGSLKIEYYWIFQTIYKPYCQKEMASIPYLLLSDTQLKVCFLQLFYGRVLVARFYFSPSLSLITHFTKKKTSLIVILFKQPASPSPPSISPQPSSCIVSFKTIRVKSVSVRKKSRSNFLVRYWLSRVDTSLFLNTGTL